MTVTHYDISHHISYHIVDLKRQNRLKVETDKPKAKIMSRCSQYQMTMSGKKTSWTATFWAGGERYTCIQTGKMLHLLAGHSRCIGLHVCMWYMYFTVGGFPLIVVKLTNSSCYLETHAERSLSVPPQVRRAWNVDKNKMAFTVTRLSRYSPNSNTIHSALVHTLWVKKGRHYTLVHIFAKYCPIFIVLSPAYSVGNLQWNYE